VGAARDDLQRISGINAEIERLLNTQGISRYAQIARWTRVEIERFEGLLGRPGRIARENWIEQAQILAKLGPPPKTAEAEPAPAGGQQATPVSDPQRPPRLMDAIRENQPRAEETTERETRTSDVTVLRSVRSEALRSEAPASGTAVPVIGGIRSARSSPPDDLKRIRGIGVLIEKKLNAMGVTGYDQIANWSTADVDRVSELLDFKGRIERENWVEQARILSAGGQTEFSRRADRGDFYGDR
jgi:predicted flap endonuclease-1-like 5' DNA nuclease